ncbi:MAG: hypothetical protein GYB55_19305 [Cytophagales bacterium]|nr:hypothetical protein [Cytophagales bacterium]
MLNPLEAELNEALIIASVKNDVVKYFVSEFYNLIPFYRKHEEILLKNEYIEINPYKYASKTYEGQIIDLNWLQNYAIHSHVLFNEVFQIIQISCLKFDVSFYNVCNEINFPINFINDNTVRFIEEQKREKEEFDNWKRIRSTNLINLFFQQYGNHEEFNKVMENLYKLGYIDSSFYWTDRKSGYKGLAINTIKFICEKKLDRKISNSEIIILLKNSFRVSVKEDLVKRRKAENLIKLDI